MRIIGPCVAKECTVRIVAERLHYYTLSTGGDRIARIGVLIKTVACTLLAAGDLPPERANWAGALDQ